MSEAMKAMQKARAQIILWNDWRAAFYGTLIMQLELVETSQVPTLATDSVSLFFNPQYVLELSEGERLAGLVHEGLHCGLLHFDRMLDLPLIERNVCMDYPINEQIVKLGLKLPKGWLHNRDYYGKSAEQLHKLIYGRKQADKPAQSESEQPESPESEQGEGQESEGDSEQPGDSEGQPSEGQESEGQPGEADTEQGTGQGDTERGQEGQEGQPGDTGQPGEGKPSPALSEQPGEGQAGQGQPGQAGQPSQGQAGNSAGEAQSESEGQSANLPAGLSESLGPGGILPSPAKSPAEQTAMRQKWEQIVRQAANAAKVRNAGTMPDVAGMIITQIEQARIDWREVLASFIDSRSVSRETWKRPDRRFAGRNYVMPSRERYGIGHLVWAVDVSGSMDHNAFDNVAAEVRAAWNEGRISKLSIVYTNTEVVKVEQYDAGDDLEINPPVGGGTDFRACMQWIADNAEDATAIIFFTDLIVSEFGEQPESEVLWLQYGDYNNAKVPFGEIVQLI